MEGGLRGKGAGGLGARRGQPENTYAYTHSPRTQGNNAVPVGDKRGDWEEGGKRGPL